MAKLPISLFQNCLFNGMKYSYLKSGILIQVNDFSQRVESFIQLIKYDEKEKKIIQTSEFDLFEFKSIDSIIIPMYSMAHVRQQYVSTLKNGELERDGYNLMSYPTFPLKSNAGIVDLEDDYISKNHRFCEDNDIESEFWDFYEEYTIFLTKKWCDENKISYA